jgi:glycosyltransferase involved in cell wall biosynthesis
MLRMYSSVDAFVLASHGEGWGLPYMEAMAMGLPCIATNW